MLKFFLAVVLFIGGILYAAISLIHEQHREEAAFEAICVEKGGTPLIFEEENPRCIKAEEVHISAASVKERAKPKEQ